MVLINYFPDFILFILLVLILLLIVVFFCLLLKGGEERTIEFLEREGRSSSKAPLLEHNHERGIIKHPFPMNYIFKPWKLGQWFYQVVKFGIVQYVCFLLRSSIFCSSFYISQFHHSWIGKDYDLYLFWQMLIKSLTAVLAVLLEAFGVYCEGDFKLRCG
jgi:hypothetical protein